MNQSERDTLADLKKVFETEFWTDVSDDEGIGSDDSMENGNTNDKEYQIQRSSQEDSDKNAIKNKIKRSKSLVAINQLRTRIIDGISRKFHDEPVVIRETVSYGEAGKSKIDVFGLDLSEMCIKTGTEVPEIVTFCIQKIEKLGVTDGIYRISGQSARVEFMKQLFKQGKFPESLTEKDVHSLASVLKFFFRCLVEPLFTYSLYETLLVVSQQPPQNHPLHLRHALEHLPHHNFKTLQYLFSHLHRLSHHHHITGMTSRNLAIVWAPNLIRTPSPDTDWSECGNHAVIIESLILNFQEVFNTSNSDPVNEISIDHAIERVNGGSLTKYKSTTSLIPISIKESNRVQNTNLKRCVSDVLNSNNENRVLRLNIKDVASDSSSGDESVPSINNSQYASLCQRHKQQVDSKTEKRKHNKPNKGDTMNRIMRKLSRIVSFRNGHYQVNNIKSSSSSLQSSQLNIFYNDESTKEYNYFQDVENVIKQFEFLEDELEQNMNDKDKSTSDINLHQTYKEEGTSRTTPCKDDKMVEEEKEEGADFGDQIMRQLETFQNSVNEVNNLFYLDPNPRNSGIFYAELVYAH